MRLLFIQYSDIMNYRTTSKIILINAIATVALVDFISFLLFRDKVQKFYSEYWNEPPSLGRGYPRYHFEKHESRGFDIAKNSKIVMAHQPIEIDPYPVWGNSIGCFDHEKKSNNRYKVYLAGDSITWGYAPLDKKFGTLLERRLDINIAACGVTHTGQIHQYSKFTDVSSQLGYFPSIVIVNVTGNDIEDDRAHPQATVISGYQLNVVKPSSSDSKDTERYSEEELRHMLQEQIKINTTSKIGALDPRKYSATTALAWRLSIPIRGSLFNIANINSSFKPYPIESTIAERNRMAITDWIKHSKKNSYRLIFADVQTQLYSGDYNLARQVHKQDFCDFVRNLSGECHSFVEYLTDHSISDWRQVIWKRDGHLSIKGENLYADFLEEIYNLNP